MARPGRPPIALTKRDQIDELLLADLYSLREIAERVGVSEKTVRNRRGELIRTGEAEHDGVLAAHERLLATPIRCRGACAGLITIVPCRGCRALRLLASERAARQLGLIPKRQASLFDADEPDLPRPKPVDVRGKFAPLVERFGRR